MAYNLPLKQMILVIYYEQYTMKLKKKILIGYSGTFVLMGLVIAWAITNLVSLGKATDAILRENYRSIFAAENMINALERQDSGMLIMFLGDTEKGIYQFRENETVFIEWLARAKDNITIRGEKELIKSIDENYSVYRQKFYSLTGLSGPRSSLKPPLKTYRESLYPVFANVRDRCIKLRSLNEETMYAASLRAGKVAGRAIWSTVLVAASASIVALILSLILAERISRPLKAFMEASRKISAGDYSIQVPVRSGDELGHLAREFNQMTARLKQYHEINIDQIIFEKNKGEAILSSIEDGMLIFDIDLKLTGINPAGRRVINMESTEISTVAYADTLLPHNLCELIRKTIETGRQPDISDEERIITLPDEEHSFYYFFSVTPIRRRDRKLIGIVILLRDVTRMKEVERLKSEFVMAASHELRTPLTSLGMSIDLLLERAVQELSEKDRALLFAAHEEVHRMKSLVNELLDLSKMETGKIELEFDSVQVSNLFENVEEVFQSQLNIKDVFLTSRLIGDVPRVHADANKATWVLTNLISNALRYVSKGGHIDLAATRIGDNVHLSVQDDGPGIPLEYQSRIFRKFVQVKGRKTDGAGLGLAICKEIVRAHGGTIWVESPEGRGTIFTFTLPVA